MYRVNAIQRLRFTYYIIHDIAVSMCFSVHFDIDQSLISNIGGKIAYIWRAASQSVGPEVHAQYTLLLQMHNLKH